jgi:hypothetical protein
MRMTPSPLQAHEEHTADYVRHIQGASTENNNYQECDWAGQHGSAQQETPMGYLCCGCVVAKSDIEAP